MSEKDLEAKAKEVNPQWEKKRLWIYIFSKIGLYLSSERESKSKNNCTYRFTLNSFFGETEFSRIV